MRIVSGIILFQAFLQSSSTRLACYRATLIGRRSVSVILVWGGLWACLASGQSLGQGHSAQLVGHETCGDCHDAELDIWLSSAHAVKSMAMLKIGDRRFNPKSHKFAKSLNVPIEQATTHESCAKCHNTSQHAGGQQVSLGGVSCESCHGPAGASTTSDGWLDVHNDFGDAFGRDDESPEHFRERIAMCEEVGMRHPSNVHQLIRACYECHIVGDEGLISQGHPTGDIEFEYLRWFQGDVLHGRLHSANDGESANRRRAVHYVVSQLADVEVSLRNRATARQVGGLATTSATRIAAARGQLRRIQQAVPQPDVEAALAEIDRVYPFIFRRPVAADYDPLTHAADQVAKLAECVSTSCDGQSLKAIEPLVPKAGVQPQANLELAHVSSQSSATWIRPQRARAERVAGPENCALCHRAEQNAWLASAHGQETFDELRTNPNARIYAKNLGIRPTDVARNSVCTDCHSTAKTDARGQSSVISGVSCESCHGGAGGENGWLNLHASYGQSVMRREQESVDHRERRLAVAKQAGMVRSADIYQLAKNCYRCHLVTNEAVVSQGGHKPGKFEFEWVEWSQGEVRHNFHLNPGRNAITPTLLSSSHASRSSRSEFAAARRRVKYLVGQLVDLEISLDNRARATTSGFAMTAAGRIAASHARLREAADASETLQPIVADLLDSIEAQLDSIFVHPLPIPAFELKRLSVHAAEVARAAAVELDGHQLEAIDSLISTRVKGKPYRPGISNRNRP